MSLMFAVIGGNLSGDFGAYRAGVTGTLIDNSGVNPRFNGVSGARCARGGTSISANVTLRGGSFQILPSGK